MTAPPIDSAKIGPIVDLPIKNRRHDRLDDRPGRGHVSPAAAARAGGTTFSS
jgi:hypothetical protein